MKTNEKTLLVRCPNNKNQKFLDPKHISPFTNVLSYTKQIPLDYCGIFIIVFEGEDFHLTTVFNKV